MKFLIFKDRLGEWRWQLLARNGNVLADSGEGYKTKRSCRSGIASIQRGAASAPVVTR